MNNVRRADLAVTYKHIPAPKTAYSTSAQGVLSQSMPMAAMFMKNKFLAWFGLLSTFHNFLTDTTSSGGAGQQPPVMQLVLGLVSILVCYMGLALPQPDAPAPKAAQAPVVTNN
ncbi:LAMI_0E09912g1_1 [Lachancea mirantina]|uniref:LAMI_0E09912g1_1 n=1 Tax=Lachancea mirantina TaxID=1230905 RepID=A0A1G4JNR8_9SACH|nr:LAMI_0E09912g1_1 [Lachancea mirantina]